MDPSHLFCFGLGYTGLTLARELIHDGWKVSGTCREPASVKRLTDEGITAFVFDGNNAVMDADIIKALVDARFLLTTVPPTPVENNGETDSFDPVFKFIGDHLSRSDNFDWIGYLSTTGVYGNTDGQVVTEETPSAPTGPRGKRRVTAERSWLSLFHNYGMPVHVFRLPGIYGPGRSTIDQVRMGKQRLIHKPGHLFNRIHVDDIVKTLRASMAAPHAGTVYNVCDNEPATPAEVTSYACKLLGVTPPPLVPFDEARKAMSDMALSFWQDNRQVSNARIRKELDVVLNYPSYREGLKAILDQEQPS